MLSQDEVDRLRDGTFEVIALQCTVQRKQAGAEVFTGPGIIRQGSDRKLLFTILLPGLQPKPSITASKPGEIIPEEEYFKAVFNDVSGRTWKSDHILAEFSYDARARGVTLSGRLGELSSTEQAVAPRKRATLTVELFYGVAVPANAASKTETSAGSFSRLGGQLNRANFETSLGTLEAKLDADRALIRLSGPERLQPNVELRLVEAIQFIAAHHVVPAVSQRNEVDQEVTRIISRGLAPQVRRGFPPLQDNIVESANTIWGMFGKYFEFVSADNSQEMHPLSRAWHRVLGAEATTIETQALIFTVVVEELVKKVSVASKDSEAVTTARAILEKWIDQTVSFLKKSGMPSDLQKRFSNQLRNLLGRRAVDKLYDMAAVGMVTETLIPRWKKLRDLSAHGEDLAVTDVETLLYDRDASLVLMHQIVFAVIGYEGYYTDYSTLGWPPRRYPPSVAATPV